MKQVVAASRQGIISDSEPTDIKTIIG